ncbi:MAG: ABC transporter permease [Oscillospiraceae bacterium]|jgi:ABC-2 type transport system permease protein|nr:ABC transporter permease [Oscillospiraceae bacterium]
MFIKELYCYRSLLREIVVKNIKIQYRNSVLGIFWTFLQPLLTTVVLVFIFGYVFGRQNDPDIVNYPIYLLCGRLLYEFYSQSTKRAMRSVTGSASVIKKVKVPKYIYPIANVISNFVTFLISLIVLVGFTAFFFLVRDPKNPPPHLTVYALLTPVPLLVLFLLCIGVGLVLSTLSVFFKDIEYLYDVFSMLLFYCTPIFYSTKTLKLKGSTGQIMMYALKANPLYSVVEMFRDCVLRGKPIYLPHFAYALGFSLVLIAIGGLLFWRKQDKFILYI